MHVATKVEWECFEIACSVVTQDIMHKPYLIYSYKDETERFLETLLSYCIAVKVWPKLNSQLLKHWPKLMSR